jgi:hypothetical protein
MLTDNQKALYWVLGIEVPENKKKKAKAAYVLPQSVKDLIADFRLYWYNLHHEKVYLNLRDNTVLNLLGCISVWCQIRSYAYSQITHTKGETNYSGNIVDATAVIDGKNVYVKVWLSQTLSPSDAVLNKKKEIEDSGGYYLIVGSFTNYLSQIKSI